MQGEAGYTTNGNYLASTTDALGKVTTYGYNPQTGALDWVQYPEDTAETRTNYTYDSMYRMATAACTTDTGLNLNAAYTYEDDLLKSIQTPSTTYDFTYGDFSLRTGVSIGNRTLATYHYTEETEDDRKFDLDRLDYGNGDSVEYEYDDEDRLIKQTYEDGDYVTKTYDNDGNLVKVYDSESGITTKYTYDLTNRLVQHTESGTDHSLTLRYTYDTLGNLSELVETVNGATTTTTYVYDADNRIVSSTNGTTVVEYGYDDFGRVETKITKNGTTAVLTESYTYTEPTTATASAQIATYTTTAISGYTVTYSYTYDDNGNIVSVSDGTNTTTYVYDSANQLYRENNQACGYTYLWTHDNAGNILYRRQFAYTTGNLSGVKDTVAYTYGDESWGDLLTAYDGNAITYDQIGNPLTDGTWTYTWQHGRQLASMTNGTTTWDYTYGANGIRTQRTNGSTTYSYVYTGSLLKEMTVGTNTLKFTYDASGTPLTVTLNGTTYYYMTNIQGDVSMIYNAAGKPVVIYTYDAWGNILSITGSLKGTLGLQNPLRYRGYIYDQETGLYYLQSRYYNPKTGRFLNADGLVTTWQGFVGNNMFAYCENNPVNYFDPDGRCKKFLGFLWKIDCGSATCKQSKNYNSAPKKVAVLYDGRTSGWFGGLLGGVGFKSQGESLISSLQSQYAVESYAFETIEDLVTDWNSLSGEYERIYILSHGYAGGLSCAGQSIGGPGLEDYSFWDLNSVSANSLYLYSCNGATVPEGGYSAAYYFSLLTGGNVHAVVNGNLGYRYGTHMPLPKGRGTWSITYAGTTTFWN